jgi:hypothetical protein
MQKEQKINNGKRETKKRKENKNKTIKTRRMGRNGRLTDSVVLVRERTIPTERPPLVGEVTTNFCG